jgi:phosphate transport system ATP-binding protein
MTAQLPLHLRPAPLPTSLDRPACCPIRTPVLEVADLSVTYGGRPALRDATVSIHRGCITAVVGPSGCGKSTFLSALNRMTDLVPGCTVTGRVILDGADIHAPGTDTRVLRRRVGMIFQKPNPFPLTILENLTFPLAHHRVGTRRRREAIAEETLRRVGLWDEVRDRLGAPARSLSGGQQQRLCLARALALDPEVLLLDEPCSALDPIASGVVEDLVASLRGRVTVVIVTHNLAQARRIADDVAVFWTEDGAGTVVEAGPAEQVLTRPASAITAAYVDGARG